MGRLMENILKPMDGPLRAAHPEDPERHDGSDADEHLSVESLARLADGCVSPEERASYARHLNRCERCYEIFKETLIDLSPSSAETSKTIRPMRWSRRSLYSMAASILLVLLLGGGFYYRSEFPSPRVMTASLALDADLRSALSEDHSLVWEGEKADRLAALLQERGVQVSKLEKVVLASAYEPYVTKSLFRPKETLRVRIEKGVAYLEVTQDKDKPKEKLE